MAMLLVVGGVSAAAAAGSDGVSAPGTVAKNPAGKMKSTIEGKTSGGGTLGGSFTPLKFKDANGVPVVKGVIDGVITSKDGAKSKFTAIRSLEVESINGQALTDLTKRSGALAACDILNLVLGPLDLNLLGLEVHLNRVVLDIVAVPGAGNLLGNLLCAVAGLLDGTDLNLLERLKLANLLNRILNLLG